MIEPYQAHDALLANIAAAESDENLFHLWWLGQSGFLLKWHGKHLLLDPYLSDSLTKKYADTDKPHVRMTELCIDPSQLDFIDVVTSSHNHTDHLDAHTLQPLMAANPNIEVIVPAANREFAAERLNTGLDRLTPCRSGEIVSTHGFLIHGLPAAHEQRELDEDGNDRFMGYLVQFGHFCIYHSGDTMLLEGLAEMVRRRGCDVALLPINGRAPERRVAGNLWGREAAQLAKDSGAKTVIPCHYDMFEFNTATPDEFIDSCEQNRSAMSRFAVRRALYFHVSRSGCTALARCHFDGARCQFRSAFGCSYTRQQLPVELASRFLNASSGNPLPRWHAPCISDGQGQGDVPTSAEVGVEACRLVPPFIPAPLLRQCCKLWRER